MLTRQWVMDLEHRAEFGVVGRNLAVILTEMGIEATRAMRSARQSVLCGRADKACPGGSLSLSCPERLFWLCCSISSTGFRGFRRRVLSPQHASWLLCCRFRMEGGWGKTRGIWTRVGGNCLEEFLEIILRAAVVCVAKWIGEGKKRGFIMCCCSVKIPFMVFKKTQLEMC